MKTTTLHVKGMHCNACKLLIEKSLSHLPYIQDVKANIHKGTVQLTHTNPLNLDDIKSVIHQAGYEVVDTPIVHPRLSKNPKDYIIAIISLIIFVVCYGILKTSGLFNGEITSTSTPSLGLVLLIGVTAGFSSCMAVVGGLILALSSKRNQHNPNTSFKKMLIPHFRFNAGRIIGFAVGGGILGIIGQSIRLSPMMMSVMILIVGIVMLLLGVNLSQLSPKLSTFSFATPFQRLFPFGRGIKAVQNFLFKKEPSISESPQPPFMKGSNKMLITGALTFFLPCGFTFAMQLYAMSTGSFRMGMLVMALFAIGTLPGLLGVGSLTSIFKGSIAKTAYQVIGILVILLGIYNISNAYGVIVATLSSSTEKGNMSYQNNETLQMTYTKNGLTPNIINLELGKHYTILIDVQTTVYGCMSTIYLPGLDTTMQSLTAGTTVTFNVDANKAGTYEFNCAMGVSHGPKIIIK